MDTTKFREMLQAGIKAAEAGLDIAEAVVKFTSTKADDTIVAIGVEIVEFVKSSEEAIVVAIEKAVSIFEMLRNGFGSLPAQQVDFGSMEPLVPLVAKFAAACPCDPDCDEEDCDHDCDTE